MSNRLKPFVCFWGRDSILSTALMTFSFTKVVRLLFRMFAAASIRAFCSSSTRKQITFPIVQCYTLADRLSTTVLHWQHGAIALGLGHRKCAGRFFPAAFVGLRADDLAPAHAAHALRPGRSQSLARQLDGLLHPSGELSLVELLVLVDVEVAHFFVPGLAGQTGRSDVPWKKATLT